MARFPDSPFYQGMNAPLRLEADVHDLEVEGEIPADLDGAFYRVAPDAPFPPLLGRDIPFSGDGSMAMFRFRNGRADFKQRYVQTDRHRLEREAGKALFGAYRNPFTDDPSVAGLNRGQGNTNTIVWRGKLFAMKEDAAPWAMDPETLETLGPWTFDDQLDSPTFTAHPKIDPETGQMIAFAFATKGVMSRDAVYLEISPEGRITHRVEFQMPFYAMAHDFGVTRDYVVFPLAPIVGDLERLKAGAPHFGWDATKEAYLGVLPRGGSASDLRWFKAPNQFYSHVMNAFNEGTKVHIDVPVARTTMFPFFPDISGAPFDPVGARAYVTRLTVDMGSSDDGFHKSERLTEFAGEFPRMDDRYAMAPYRHGWVLQMSGTRCAFAHLDHATGRVKTWTEPETTSLQEPCFAPRPGGTAEGDGYIIQLANRRDEMRTDLLLLDALRIDEGPIATVRLPMRLRLGYHGSWAAADQLSNPAPA